MFKNKRYISAVMGIVLSVSSVITLHAAEQVTDASGETHEYVASATDVYDTDDESMYNFDFDKKIEIDGKEMILDHIEYSVTSLYDKEYGNEDINDELTRTQTVSYMDKSSFKPEVKSLSENNFTYDYEKVIFDETGHTIVKMESYVDTPLTNSEFNKSDYPDTMSYEYEDGNYYDLSYKDYEIIDDGWFDYTLNGVIYNYGAPTYEIGNVSISYADINNVATTEQLQSILEYWGYSNTEYRPVTATFNGDAYTNSDGVVCRDYTIYCEAYGKQYRVNYESDIELPEYTATLTYTLSDGDKAEIEQLKSSYEVTANAFYDMADQGLSTVQRVVIGTGVVVVLILIAALIIYIIRGGRKRTEYMSKREARREFKDI